MRMFGVGGEFTFEAFRAASVQIGNVTFRDFGAFRVTGSSYGGADDGLIGPSFLRYFTVYVDYGNSALYLVPNATGRAAMGIRS